MLINFTFMIPIHYIACKFNLIRFHAMWYLSVWLYYNLLIWFICPIINGTFVIWTIKNNAYMKMFYRVFALVIPFIVWSQQNTSAKGIKEAQCSGDFGRHDRKFWESRVTVTTVSASPRKCTCVSELCPSPIVNPTGTPLYKTLSPALREDLALLVNLSWKHSFRHVMWWAVINTSQYSQVRNHTFKIRFR